jgi:hypothetical protein
VNVRVLASSAALAAMTAGEAKLFDRLLFGGRADYSFVLEAVKGVLAGTPVSPSWQQRLLGPLAVSLLGTVTASPVGALRLFAALAIAGANLLLFGVVTRRRNAPLEGLLAVAAFGLAHLLLLYRLEYPWDGIDVLVFLVFGAWASRRGRLAPLGPLLIAGTMNHETVLYVPLWYLLSPLERGAPPAERREALRAGLLASLLIAGAIVLLRKALYIGVPQLPAQVFEPVTPFLENHIHLGHNLRQLLFEAWRMDRAPTRAALLLAITVLVVLAGRRTHVRAAAWTLCILFTIVCFGYIHETRHYLAPVAFWFAYGWPSATRQRPGVGVAEEKSSSSAGSSVSIPAGVPTRDGCIPREYPRETNRSTNDTSRLMT